MKDGRGDGNEEESSRSAIYILYCSRVARRARAACNKRFCNKARCETYVRARLWARSRQFGE